MTPSTASPTDVQQEPRRLHPITLLQRFILSLPGFAAVLLATYRSPDSTNWASLIATVLYAVIALPLIYLRYSRFRYWITPREIVIQSGVFTRQHRNIPLEKIQNVSIVQRLLPRLTSTASVQVVTAGSTTAEGVLEYVAMREAHRIRNIVRAYKRGESPAASADAMATDVPRVPDVSGAGAYDEPFVDEAESGQRELVLQLSPRHVLLSGAMRFSLLYIAIIFSLLQFFQPDPEALTRWLLQERYSGFVAAVRRAPALAALVAAVSAALLSWFSGIAVNLNKFYGFRLWDETDKVSKKTGLLTVSERSIPKRKIQAVILRSNPVMQAFGWIMASVQTVGHDISRQGYAVVAPLIRRADLGSLLSRLTSVELPADFVPVSPRRAGRLFFRYLLLLATMSAVLALAWTWWWVPIATAPFFFVLARLQRRAHGFAAAETGLVVRRGLVKKQVWIIPYDKMQVFYGMQSLFQRRRDLKSVYVDTAGASGFSTCTIFDLRTADADHLIAELYHRFIARTN